VGIVHLARYARKREWLDQELAEFFRVRDALIQAGLDVDTDHGVTDEGDPWFVFVRPQTEEVTAHFARIDGQFVADSSASPLPLYGRDLRSLLSQVFRQQMALIPARDGNGNVTLHPASMLVAFVATAFLQVQQGTREGVRGAGEGLHGEGLHGDGHQGDGLRALVGGRSEEGGKSLTGRLTTTPTSSTAPANPAGRAVTFSDSGIAADHGITGGIMTTVLFAALGALGDLDAAAAERGEGDPGADRPTLDGTGLPLAVALATPRGGDVGDGTAGAGETGARANRIPAPGDAASDADSGGPQGDGTQGEGAATPTPDPSAAPLAVAARPAPVPVPSDLDVEGSVAPALRAVPEPEPEATAEGEAGSPDGGGGVSEAFLLTDLETRELVTLGDSNLFEDSVQIIFRDALGGRGASAEGDAAPSLDVLMSAANQGVPESLSSIVSFIAASRGDPAAVAYDPATLFGQASDAFTDPTGERPTFVLFESDAIKATAFAFMPGIVLLDSRALDEVPLVLESTPEEIDLAGEDDITLLGVVQVGDVADGDGFGG